MAPCQSRARARTTTNALLYGFEHAPNNRKLVADASQFTPVRCATRAKPCHALYQVGVLSRSRPGQLGQTPCCLCSAAGPSGSSGSGVVNKPKPQVINHKGGVDLYLYVPKSMTLRFHRGLSGRNATHTPRLVRKVIPGEPPSGSLPVDYGQMHRIRKWLAEPESMLCVAIVQTKVQHGPAREVARLGRG